MFGLNSSSHGWSSLCRSIFIYLFIFCGGNCNQLLCYILSYNLSLTLALLSVWLWSEWHLENIPSPASDNTFFWRRPFLVLTLYFGIRASLRCFHYSNKTCDPLTCLSPFCPRFSKGPVGSSSSSSSGEEGKGAALHGSTEIDMEHACMWFLTVTSDLL